ncbi:MAG: prepilin-type N-terminal cleavage/methylation domain-containing protein [Myxococcales bacterium]|nr:prepilin-type N-terminal cleavage/methylation domain-containing protein [Myxococcales bacterium]
MTRTARRRGGFTLIELMVVVAIVSVLVLSAWVYLRPDPRPIDVADQLSGMVSEASRRAVASGPVRANVSDALGVSARTRVIIEAGDPVVISLERLEEDPSPTSTAAAWVEFRRVALARQVKLAGWTEPPTVSATAGPANTLASGASKEIYCEANGRCSGVMVYFESATGKYRARMVLLPLGGTPITFSSW